MSRRAKITIFIASGFVIGATTGALIMHNRTKNCDDCFAVPVFVVGSAAIGGVTGAIIGGVFGAVVSRNRGPSLP